MEAGPELNRRGCEGWKASDVIEDYRDGSESVSVVLVERRTYRLSKSDIFSAVYIDDLRTELLLFRRLGRGLCETSHILKQFGKRLGREILLIERDVIFRCHAF